MRDIVGIWRLPQTLMFDFGYDKPIAFFSAETVRSVKQISFANCLYNYHYFSLIICVKSISVQRCGQTVAKSNGTWYHYMIYTSDKNWFHDFIFMYVYVSHGFTRQLSSCLLIRDYGSEVWLLVTSIAPTPRETDSTGNTTNISRRLKLIFAKLSYQIMIQVCHLRWRHLINPAGNQ